MLGSFFRKGNPKQHFELDLPPVEPEHHSEVAHPHPPTAEDENIIVPPSKEPVLSSKNVALFAVLLMLLAVGMGIWSWVRFNGLRQARNAESQQHEVVLDSLLQVKAGLERNLDSLESSFSDMRSQNDTLAKRLADATNIIEEKDIVIREVKNNNTREEAALRAQVQQLQTVKDRYETIIAVLNKKNAQLEEENAELRGTTEILSSENTQLGSQLEAQILKTMSAQYKASALRVEMTRRNDKVTLRAKRTRELSISFDLNHVPGSYQGNQQLYLVITDEQGVPIPSKNPIQATIKTEKGAVPIVAQGTQMQNIIANQHIVLNYKLEDRLKKGTYLVSIYSDKGLLGVTSFRLV